MPCAGAVHGVSGLLYSARRGLAHSEPEAQARVGAKSLACASGSDCVKVNRLQYNRFDRCPVIVKERHQHIIFFHRWRPPWS